MPSVTVPIRVLVVDDSAVVRHIIVRALDEDPAIEVLDTAPNGRIALEKVEKLRPDIITLDIEMPEMDGLTTLEHLQRRWPALPVIMFSSLTEFGAVATLRALSLGAKDYVTKPAGVRGMDEAVRQIQVELAAKIKALMPRASSSVSASRGTGGRGDAATKRRGPAARSTPAVDSPAAMSSAGGAEVLVIGVSTGGPKALSEVLPALPADLPVPVLVVQHMPAVFTRYLAESLDKKCSLAVREGTDGTEVQPGTIWIAPGDFHMRVARGGNAVRIQIARDAPQNYCRPAVDALFRSVADVYGGHVLAAVLTGMGRDGLEGARIIRAAGGTVVAQDEASSVVWGMPRAVAEAGVAHEVLPLSGIAPALTHALMHTGKTVG